MPSSFFVRGFLVDNTEYYENGRACNVGDILRNFGSERCQLTLVLAEELSC